MNLELTWYSFWKNVYQRAFCKTWACQIYVQDLSAEQVSQVKVQGLSKKNQGPTDKNLLILGFSRASWALFFLNFLAWKRIFSQGLVLLKNFQPRKLRIIFMKRHIFFKDFCFYFLVSVFSYCHTINFVHESPYSNVSNIPWALSYFNWHRIFVSHARNFQKSWL